jgi:crotonobetainyl-CoA:carnitine CoA-transferase CaiB-like acyl-CoA transferase
MTSPLDGIRVIDLSRYIAGPLCTQLLGDLGAEVLKVEAPRGEEGRLAFPLHEGFSLYFANFNRNKRGATLNLRTDQGKALLRELVACSDVLVQNYRVGVMEEMGMAYPELAKLNPRLILVNISGFGRTSALATWPAYDEIAQAMSGLMDLTGPPEGLPTLVGTAIVDHLTGIYAAYGTLAALEQRWRTGRGQEVDLALVHSATSVLLTSIPRFLLTGTAMTRNGNRHPLHAAINTYATKDGYIHIVAPMDPMWGKLAEVLGRGELRTHPDYATMQARAARKDEIDALIAAWTAQHTSQAAATILAQAGVACGPVRRIQEVATDPELRQQGLVLDVQAPGGGTVPVMGNPVKLASAPVQVWHSPPALGQDNAYVYCEVLGHSPADVQSWRESGVL